MRWVVCPCWWRSVRDSVIHPTIGEKIPLAWRMSCFAPANVPITAGMLMATSVRSCETQGV